MPRPKEDVFDVVHAAFDLDEQQTKIRDPEESPSLARRVVEAVLDLHHADRGQCYLCSRGRVITVPHPCPTVQAIVKVVRPDKPLR